MPLVRLKRRPHGFTLLEILLVIVIVGILAGLAVLSVGGGDQQQLQHQVQRVRAVLQMASDRALLEGREYGLVIKPDSYTVVVFDDSTDRWQTLDRPAFATHKLPIPITLHLSAEGTQVQLEQLYKTKGGADSNAATAPALLLFSSGANTPFELHFQGKASQQPLTLVSTGLGDFEITHNHD